jgi:polysaccharide export outer membrane protein
MLALLALTAGCASSKMPPNVSESDSGIVSLTPPEPQDFTFGPGDAFELRVWRQPELDMNILVAPDGYISIPLMGRVKVSGKTYPELIEEIQTGLTDYYNDPQVSVNIVQVSNQKVFVLGEVRNPAVLQIENDLSMIEALTRTGGINPDARTDNILLVRGGLEKPELYTVRVDDIFAAGDFSQNVYLQKGDIVLVPPRTIVNVERFFRRVQALLAPFVAGSAVYRNSTTGGAQGTGASLIQ